MARRHRSGAWRLVVVTGVVALLLTSCTWATDTSAVLTSDTTAVLSGEVHGSLGQTVHSWFEYGPTPAYGMATDRRPGSSDRRVGSEVTGLAPDTTYHYRLCTRGSDGLGACSYDATFETAGTDSVRGGGTTVTGPSYGVGLSIQAWSKPGGAEPGGSGFAMIGYDRTVQGYVTCLRVEGNRATIGMDLENRHTGGRVGMFAFIEDNGPTGDRYGNRFQTTIPTSCPVAEEADFVASDGSQPVSANVTSGDFVVHDHSEAG